MNKKQENRAENKKHRLSFILLMIGSLVVGGFAGFFIVRFQGNLADALESLRNNVSWAISNLFPYANIGCLAILLACYFPLYYSAKKQLAAWDQEDEAVYYRIDRKLSRILAVQSVLQVLSFFFFGSSVSNLFSRISANGRLTTAIIPALSFMVLLIALVLTQRSVVDLAKEMNPEKHGSVYEMKFSKTWMNSCDEAEKMMAYKAAYHAFQVTNYTCMALWLVFVLLSMLVPMSILALACISLIWLVMTVSYLHAASKAGTPSGASI